MQTSIELKCKTIGRKRVEHIITDPFMQMIWNGDKAGVAEGLNVEIRHLIKKRIAPVNVISA